MTDGDVNGIGKYIGLTLSAEQCMTMVTCTEPEANGMEWKTGSTHCIAKFGVSHFASKGKHARACIFRGRLK